MIIFRLSLYGSGLMQTLLCRLSFLFGADKHGDIVMRDDNVSAVRCTGHRHEEPTLRARYFTRVSLLKAPRLSRDHFVDALKGCIS